MLDLRFVYVSRRLNDPAGITAFVADMIDMAAAKRSASKISMEDIKGCNG